MGPGTGQSAGTLGFCGCFSFYPGKNLGAYGEAGAVVTYDDQVADRLRALRDHAQSRRTTIANRLQLPDGWVPGSRFGRQTQVSGSLDRGPPPAGRRYRRACRTSAHAARQGPGTAHVWHLFVVLHPERDRIRRELEARGIQTGLHYPVPVHLQDAYAPWIIGRAIPHLRAHRPGLLLVAAFPEMTERQQDRVIGPFTNFFRSGME